MSQEYGSDSVAKANFNMNNNCRSPSSQSKSQKPSLPSKPEHLQPKKKLSFTNDCVTPKGWTPQPKLAFAPKERLNTTSNENIHTHSESKPIPKWRPAPRVKQKQDRLTDDTKEYKSQQKNIKRQVNVTEDEQSDGVGVQKNVSDQCNYRSHSKSLLLEDHDEKGFGTLKRMWSQKTKDSDKLQSLQPSSPVGERRNDIEGYSSPNASTNSSPVHLKSGDSIDSSNTQSVSRSTSSSSTGSFHTTSFKNRKDTWHYITTKSPTSGFVAEAFPSQIKPDESLVPEPIRERKFNHAILTARPFRAPSINLEDDTSYSSIRGSKPRASNKSANYNSNNDNQTKTERHHRKQETSAPEKKDNLSSSEEVDADEKEMRRARKSGTLVTRFDSRGNMYSVNPRSGEVSYIENELIPEVIYGDVPSLQKQVGQSDELSQKMNALLNEGSITSNTRHRLSEKSPHHSSTDETPPPLLPREKFSRKSKPSYASTAGYRQSSMTANSMYSSKGRLPQPQLVEVSPDSAVPPPILPRGQKIAATQDYTPMTGSTDIPIHDRASIGSSTSLNSFLDQAAYEAMGGQVQDGSSYEPMGPNEEEETFNYSSAVDPAQHEISTREYHEIDPDPDVPIGAMTSLIVDPSSVPPPPNFEPPILSPNAKLYSTQTSLSKPHSPPPLPPMNTGHQKLNYVEVETGVGSGDIRGKSKTKYTEVIIGGGIPDIKNDSNAKKGKGKKLKSKKSGYLSEGDITSSNKNGEDGDEKTTDFAKERNKLKRLSGRLLRKKKHKSRDYSHQHSTENEKSTNKERNNNAAVGIYSSATNLTTLSSESSRSQVASSNSGSSGDGQAKLQHNQGHNESKHIKADRRQSHEPSTTQLPPKLDQKSRSEIHLDSSINLPKSHLYPHHSPQPFSKSAGNTPAHSTYRTQISDTGGLPANSTHHIQSHLHPQRSRTKVLPTSPRPVSEPPVSEPATTEYPQLRPISSPYDLEQMRRSPRLSRDMVLSLVLPSNIQADRPTDSGQLSPNVPVVSPPSPPSLHHLPKRLDGTEEARLRPPTPMRDLKPDRFKKRLTQLSGSEDYTAAEDLPLPKKNEMFDAESDDNLPIYDDVEMDPNRKILPRTQFSMSSKLLESEPLYQVYRSRTLSHASTKVRGNLANKRRNKTASAAHGKRNSSDSWQSDLMIDDAGSTTLWREVKEVVESGLGKDLTNSQMKLQQAQFEVVTSQASYMRSLNILIDHFMKDWSMESTDILLKKQRKELFSNIIAVREVELKFLQEIEQHFWDSIYLTDIAKITAKYAVSDFEVYVRYVQNQVYQDRVLTELQRTNDKFAIHLTRLESSPSCNKLPLLSFLLLPMQRVTRLPLLISAIVNQADTTSANDAKAYKSGKEALGIVNKLVKKCNEGARKMQQIEQLAEIARDLVFANKVKTYALVSQSRHLVKKGEMSVTMIQENKKSKVSRLWLFLLSDVLLLARKKTFLESGSSVKYEVINWAKRQMLFVNVQAVSENEIFLVLLEDSFGKRVELTFSPVSLNELSRWTEAFNPRGIRESEDSIYEAWDCPQYQCISPYSAQQPDELPLDVGDVMKVLTKTGDGWLEGERLRDNEMGWFPAENCEEIEDEHVRARNMRNLYRILPPGEALNE